MYAVEETDSRDGLTYVYGMFASKANAKAFIRTYEAVENHGKMKVVNATDKHAVANDYSIALEDVDKKLNG